MEEQSAFVKDLYDMYEKGEWRKILKLGQSNASEETKKYHWCWPYEQDLKDLKSELDKLGVKSLCSIGCGTGILEWCLNKCTGMEVKGIEVDEFYWVSANAPKPFINLEFAKRKLPSSYLGTACTRLPNYGLLFCYFNNPRAFKDYVRYFIGNYLIMIGPSLKTPPEKHVDPMPEEPDFETPKLWVKAWNTFSKTKPFIDLKILKRRLSNSPLNNLLSRSRDEALLFCYFNNPDAFKSYIKYFYGDYVIIIGPPLKSKTKRSNPMPETPNFENPALWFKVYQREIGRDNDVCVIWKYNPSSAILRKNSIV
uniref:CSON009063 protein n=1 Tax=Culicoides sonorensis TaxID=179676 RepID=A0A336LZP9_CULSO